jgi:hypothetical protein
MTLTPLLRLLIGETTIRLSNKEKVSSLVCPWISVSGEILLPAKNQIFSSPLSIPEIGKFIIDNACELVHIGRSFARSLSA